MAYAVPPPRPAVLVRDGQLVNTGVLLLRLMSTTILATHLVRPQVILHLDHFGERSECRSTGVRERWGHHRASLQHGTADWGLNFSFCVDVPTDNEGGTPGEPSIDPRLVYGRFLQVRFLGMPFKKIKASVPMSCMFPHFHDWDHLLGSH
jgi:hypothetical protein